MAAHVRTQHSTANNKSSRNKRVRVEEPENKRELPEKRSRVESDQVEKKKRKCGLCHTPGHYRTKCPNK